MTTNAFKRISPRVYIVCVAALTAIAYAPSLTSGLIADDFSLIEQASRSTLLSLFTQSGDYFRPLIGLSFLLEHSLWDAQAFGYHLTNLLLHVVNTVLVCLIARETLKHSGSGWLVCGVYFGLTPTHASSVLWVLGRTDLLCATGYLVCILLFTRSLKRSCGWTMLGSCAAALFALLCKEMALSIPVVGLVISYGLSTTSDMRLRVREALVAALPLFIAVAIYIGYRLALFASLPGSTMHESATLSTILLNIPRNAISLTLPLDLESIKPFFRANQSLLLLLSVVITLVSLRVILRLVGDPIVFATVVCTVICLVPVLRVFAPWYLYIPSVGVAIVVGRLTDQVSLAQVSSRVVAIVALLVHLSGLAQAQLWTHTSGQIADRVVREIRRSIPVNGRAVVLSVPTEYRGVPVFGWIGNLGYALSLVGHPVTIDTVVGLRMSDTTVNTEFEVDIAGQIRLAIPGDRDFFRLQDLSILTGATRPGVGQVFESRHAKIGIDALNASGHPSRLTITPRSFSLSDSGIRVFAFVGGTLRDIKAR